MLCNDIHTALETILQRYEQVVVIADEAVTPDWSFPTLRLTTNESMKSIETVEQIWDFLFSQDMTRRGLLIAIGGGVLTDLAGFAASTYKRGIDYITVPTTLLSMVDAASGGKTGFNYHGLKNSIGVFAPPVETLIWPGWLKTLPSQQFLSGFGEMLKTGLIDEGLQVTGDGLWERLLQYDLDTMPLDTLTPLIEACVRAKEAIVAADPHETGLRKILNFGHTFGHALEEISLIGEAGHTAKRSYSETVLQRSGLTAQRSYTIVAVLSGLEPHRTILEKEILARFGGTEKQLLIVEGLLHRPNTRIKRGNITIVPHMADGELAAALKGAKHIIARSGYSTIMDLETLGLLNSKLEEYRPEIELIPTPGQPEQEYLATWIEQKALF